MSTGTHFKSAFARMDLPKVIKNYDNDDDDDGDSDSDDDDDNVTFRHVGTSFLPKQKRYTFLNVDFNYPFKQCFSTQVRLT